MGPLSAVAIVVTFILFGPSVAGWATINAHFLGAVFIIAAVLILIDVFWHVGAPYVARRRTVAE